MCEQWFVIHPLFRGLPLEKEEKKYKLNNFIPFPR